jgi:hypothetical protein
MLWSGALSHRSTYNRIHRSLVWCATALSTRSCGTLSKNARISRSITQFVLQQRSRQAATASSADRPGRYPYESGWKLGSTFGSRYIRTTVCATLSATVGTPRIRTPLPPTFGISTAFTGGGK